MNRTEVLDTSRAAIGDKQVTRPRRDPKVKRSALHVPTDAKVREEDEKTGAKRYRYVRTGEDHYSLAFTYAWLGATHLLSVAVHPLCWCQRQRCAPGRGGVKT